MKIKQIAAIFCVFVAVACQDHRLDGMVNDQVYILQNGAQEIMVNSKDYADFSMTLYKSGMGTEKANVTLEISENALSEYNEKNGTSYQLLPEQCYMIGETNFSFAEKTVSKVSVITFDGALIKKKQALGEKKYVLPIKINVTGSVDVNPTKTVAILIPILE